MKYITLTNENFAEETVAGLVVIDFWAVWCGPCRMMTATLDEITDEEAAGVKLCKVNVDEQPEIADRFDIDEIPTLVFIKDGKTVLLTKGYKDVPEVIKLFEKYR